ncbi:MAG: M20/M25/M40 family metallo-hydrolase [Bacteroidetes bacterium]|nr:M20/M25/M40 family metallo-hydrolase [Bacteroidota bacterium]
MVCLKAVFNFCKLYIFILVLLSASSTFAQSPKEAADSVQLRQVFNLALTQSSTYENLRELCQGVGPRLSGSAGAQQAVLWAEQKLRDLGADSVWLQPVAVPHWVRGTAARGTTESARLHQTGKPDQDLAVCALGGSVGTPEGGIRAGVVEVYRLTDLAKLGREKIEGKIVLYNRPMEPVLINTFEAYSGCVDQRASGAAEAAEYGTVGVLVRSMNLRMDDLPHTGTMSYREGLDSIPAAAISTNAAAALSKALRDNPNLEVSLELSCRVYPDALSYNVIGQINGSRLPDEIILVGGHLDSWDLGEGAHDDGAGCVQAMAVLEAYRQAGLRPERTVRCVLFMNEENGQRGAEEYARLSGEKSEVHVAAIESDRGGFTPRGFTVDGVDGVRETALARLRDWMGMLAPYGIHFADLGSAGVDISHLKPQNAALFGFVPDSQRYFDYHHAANDRFDAVNKRELELGAATLTSLIYLIDQHGILVQAPGLDQR